MLVFTGFTVTILPVIFPSFVSDAVAPAAVGEAAGAAVGAGAGVAVPGAVGEAVGVLLAAPAVANAVAAGNLAPAALGAALGEALVVANNAAVGAPSAVEIADSAKVALAEVPGFPTTAPDLAAMSESLADSVSEVYTEAVQIISAAVPISISVNEVLRFVSQGQKHDVAVLEIAESSVTFRFRSEPVIVQLSVGDVKHVDLDNDGREDIIVTLKDIVSGKAIFTITEIGDEPFVAIPLVLYILLPLFVALIIALVLAAINIKKNRARKVGPAALLAEFCRKQRALGHTQAHIKHALIKKGWSKKVVNTYVSKFAK